MVVVGLGYQSCDENLSSSKLTNVVSNNINHQPTPASIAMLLDKSKSVEKYGVPSLTLADFDGFIRHIKNNGGVLSVGTIGANSDKAFISVSLDLPPVAPVKPDKANFSNDFEALDSLNHYKRELLPAYEAKYDDWKNTTEIKIKAFQANLEMLLNAPADEPYTDINNALNRANIYHTANPSFKAYTFIISDGIDDRNQELKPVSGLVALVYGSEKYSKEFDKLANFKRLPDLDAIKLE